MKFTTTAGSTYSPPISFQLRDRHHTRRSPTQQPSGRDGAIVTGPASVEPRTVTVSGTLTGADLQDQLDQLTRVLHGPGLRLYPFDDDPRFLHVTLETLREHRQQLTRSAEVELRLIAHDPYWYGDEVTDAHAASTNPSAWDVTVAGTADVLPVITVSCGAQLDAPRLEHLGTGEFVELTGTYPLGTVIEVDTGRAHVTIDGVTALGALTDEAALRTLTLLPGVNQLQLTAIGGVTATVEFRYRPRWL